MAHGQRIMRFHLFIFCANMLNIHTCIPWGMTLNHWHKIYYEFHTLVFFICKKMLCLRCWFVFYSTNVSFISIFFLREWRCDANIMSNGRFVNVNYASQVYHKTVGRIPSQLALWTCVTSCWNRIYFWYNYRTLCHEFKLLPLKPNRWCGYH